MYCKKMVFLKIREFHKKTPMLECLFNNVASRAIKKRLQDKNITVKFAKFLRTSILKNIYEQLPLDV